MADNSPFPPLLKGEVVTLALGLQGQAELFGGQIG
jgi:hypothetical protein